MSNYEINQRTLEIEATFIADSLYAFGLKLATGDKAAAIDYALDKAYEETDSHQWVIYNYPALLLCANCDTTVGEEWLEQSGFTEWSSIGQHASAVAHATLYCLVNDKLAEIEHSIITLTKAE